MLDLVNKLQNFDLDSVRYFQSVIVLCAGGTINMSGLTERKPANGVQNAIEAIRKKFESLNITIIVLNIFDRPPDSSNIGESEWTQIYNSIAAVINKKKEIAEKLIALGIALEQGGIVVAHGTDTLHITSLVISLELLRHNLAFPIVFTASHSTFEMPNSDARKNLEKSIFVAKECFANPKGLLPGVYVLIGQDIHLASRLTKVLTAPNSEGKYFVSFPSPIGQITESKSEMFHFSTDNDFYRALISSNNIIHQEFRAQYNWGIVEYVYIDKFTRLEIVADLRRRLILYNNDRLNENRRKGVVIQGNFTANVEFQKIAEELQLIDKEKMVILLGSKRTFEKLTSTQSYRNLGIIPKSMSHLKAKIKLAWLLRYEYTNEKIINLMNTNLVGEVFETNVLPEWINFETFHNFGDGTEVILAYPNISDKVLSDATERLLQSSCVKLSLYIYGFGDGHYPTTNLPIVDIIEGYLGSYQLNSTCHLAQDATLEEIIKHVSKLVKSQKKSIISYFDARYDIDEPLLRNLLKKKVFETVVEKEKKALSKKITIKLGSKNSDDRIMIKLRDNDPLMSYLYQCIDIKVDSGYIDALMNSIIAKYNSFQNPREMINLLIEYLPDLLAKRLMKDAVMSVCKNMRVLGTAIDKGISVHIKTQAVKSRTDTSKYEAGNFLMIVGVNSDITSGYNMNVFKKKQT